MSYKSDQYCSIPELRQQVFEQWYEEWEMPKDTLGTVAYQQVFKPLINLPSLIRSLIQPISKRESTAAPHSTLETGAAR